MNIMHSTILNAQVANQTRKVVNSHDESHMAQNREDFREEMWIGFAVGIGLSIMLLIGYWFIIPEFNNFIGAVYLVFYLICKMTLLVACGDKQDNKVVKTALKLCAILTVSMLLPLIVVAKDTFDIVCLGIWCLCATVCPLVKLYRMRKK